MPARRSGLRTTTGRERKRSLPNTTRGRISRYWGRDGVVQGRKECRGGTAGGHSSTAASFIACRQRTALAGRAQGDDFMLVPGRSDIVGSLWSGKLHTRLWHPRQVDGRSPAGQTSSDDAGTWLHCWDRHAEEILVNSNLTVDYWRASRCSSFSKQSGVFCIPSSGSLSALFCLPARSRFALPPARCDLPGPYCRYRSGHGPSSSELDERRARLRSLSSSAWLYSLV